MTVDTTIVLSKIKKLLALSTSSNPNEAALAAAKAQELLMQHNLTISQVNTQQTTQYNESLIKTGRGVWRRVLLTIIAKSNFCEVVYFPKLSQSGLIGEAHNQEVVIYLYTYLVEQIEHMALIAYAKSDTQVHAKSWKDSFYMGAVKSIHDRLKEQRNEAEAASNACRSLVIVKGAELRAAVYKIHPNLRDDGKKHVKPSGFYEGLEAGRSVSLNKALE